MVKRRMIITALMAVAIPGVAGCGLKTSDASVQTQNEEVLSHSRPEDEKFLEYLRNIYTNSSDIIKSHPVDIKLGEHSYDSGWTTYRLFNIDDFDGDGTDELLIHCFGPYNGGLGYDGINLYNNTYPSYDMYELSSDGNVVEKDSEPYTMHGDVWMLRLENRDADYSNPSLFTFYDNGVFKFEITEGGEKKEAYYVYDDSIYEKIKDLGHFMFKDKSVYGDYADRILGEDGFSSSICYTTDSTGIIYRNVGSHQDGVRDVLTKQEYDDEIRVLTSGRKLGTGFKEFIAGNLGMESRPDSLDENVRYEKETGYFDEYYRVSGEIYTDEAGAAILKLDLPFLMTVTGYDTDRVLKISEIQLMDKDGNDLTGITGHHEVTGRAYLKYSSFHRRDLLLNVENFE